MGKIWQGIVWAFARNTEAGKKLLGEETLMEQGVRHKAGQQAVQAALGYVRDGQRSGGAGWLLHEHLVAAPHEAWAA